MSITVEARGQEFEFPDGTSPDAIGVALDEYFSQSQQPDQPQLPEAGGLGGIGATVGQGLTKLDEITHGRPAEQIPNVRAVTEQLISEGVPESEAFGQAVEHARQFSPVEGAKDVVKTLAANVLGGTVGMVGGSIEGILQAVKSGQLGTKEGAELAQSVMKQRLQDFTAEPETVRGREFLSAIGEAAEPLSSLPPFVPGAQPSLIGRVSVIKSKNVSEAIQGSGNEIIDSALKVRIPDNPNSTPLKETLKQKLAANDADVAFLGKTLVDEKITKTPGIGAAKKQGFDDTVLRSIETASPETKASMRQMLGILKRRRANADFRAVNRVTDELGVNVYERYKALNKLRKTEGKKVSEAANTLKGKDFDFDVVTGDFFRELKEAGIRVAQTAEGEFKPDFKNVDVSDIAGTRKAINAIFDRFNRTGRKDAFQAHKLKTLINDSVEFGKLPSADAKIAKGVEAALKRYSHNLNEQLRDISDDYTVANDSFKQVIEPLSDMDQAFKTMLKNSSGEALEKGIGTRAARTIMSNNVGRAGMLETLKKAELALKANNISFKDNLIKQAVFADELERMFGSEATTSLGGTSQRATEQAVRAALGADIIPEIAVSGVKKFRGINEDNAIKALEKILGVE